MTRFEDDPDAHERWLASVEAEDHFREVRLERSDRHGPAPAATHCWTCGRDIAARVICGSCGDAEDMAA